MRLAIVGGGFFGCYFARFLEARLGRETQIDIYDRAPQLMTQAAVNNQARLHLGFHYPRSPETIRQTVQGYQHFIEEFAPYVSFPRKNLYAVHRDGHLSFDQYLRALDEFPLRYELCGASELKYFAQPASIEGVIRVGEGTIDLLGLRKEITSSLRARFFGNAVVTAIDSESGYLKVNGKSAGPYDFFINSTYVNPNLGLSGEQRFELKYELACMVLISQPFGEDVAVTIMDGNFVSLYPWTNGLATLSSVKYTRCRSFSELAELEAHLGGERHQSEVDRAAEMIVRHGRELLAFGEGEVTVQNILVAAKCKLRNDVGDTRESKLRMAGRVISVLAGKLDACRTVAEQILGCVVNSPGIRP